MSQQLVQEIQKKHMSREEFPIEIGDLVEVYTEIVEGDKTRVQKYEGTVVQIKGENISKTFTVHRVSFGYANEKVFPFYSPSVKKVLVIQKGRTRKSKLGYIRGQVGKKAKVKAKIT